MSTEFMPHIVVFCCNWCSYAGADLAGVSRLQMKPYFTIIRTMCSCRIEPVMIIEALNNGADGVLIAGCHPGDCHYMDGNYKTRRRYYLLRNMLRQFNIDTRKVKLVWVSASEGAKFQQEINTFIDEVVEFNSNNNS